MITSLKHRGPDDAGFFSDSEAGLACARLSIIDLKGGHDPMVSEDGYTVVVQNGEIYNFSVLRNELEAAGHRFRTRSDTEVIIHSYEQYGDRFVEKLHGMFAIAVWDARRRKLLLARDRMGVKPLYYAVRGVSLLFASEVKAILRAGVPGRVDPEALGILVNLGYLLGPRTLLAGIFKLPPASLLTFRAGKIDISSYWSPPPLDRNIDPEETAARLRSVLEQAIRGQLVADVPVGCFLSGGLDTSTLVAFAARSIDRPLKTFCMGFGEEIDEFADARLVAARFGTDHHELVVDDSDAVQMYPKMIWHTEQPKYNLYPWFVCELVRKNVKVCLSGNGGDEVFGGYVNRYGRALAIDRLGRVPGSRFLEPIGRSLPEFSSSQLEKRRRILAAAANRTEKYLVLAGAFSDTANRRLLPAWNLAALKMLCAPFFTGNDFLQEVIGIERRTKLVEDLLAVDDAMSMAHSLEVRVPLLDDAVVDLAARVPWHFNFSPKGLGKLMLRAAVQDLLPAEVLTKPKQGFSVDVSRWYAGELGELAAQTVPDSEPVSGYFGHSEVLTAAKRAASGERRYQILMWQLFGFHLWHRIFIDGDASKPEKLGPLLL